MEYLLGVLVIVGFIGVISLINIAYYSLLAYCVAKAGALGLKKKKD